MISVVAPVYNEAESLAALHAEVAAVMARTGQAYELIFVDDGSTDEGRRVLEALAADHGEVKLVEFRRNFGKAAALDAGFRAARGDVVVTMDADLQDDPTEIPRLVAKLGEGYDVVSGWKKRRRDPVSKTAPSKLFNAVVSQLSGVRLNDFNCGFKAYRAEALTGLSLYGELHRFIPVLLHWRGFRVGEVAVNHRARRFGASKFGPERLMKGALDLLTVILNTRFRTRPLHVFGVAGIALGILGVSILSYLTVLWFAGAGPIGDRPLLLLGMLLVMSSFQFLTVGLLGELIQRQNSQENPSWVVRRTVNIDEVQALDPAIAQLRRAAALMQDFDTVWNTQRQSAETPAGGTPANTPTKIRSTA